MSSTELWPNFFIAGAAKCGTFSLFEYLDKIPDIFMSPLKEPHYFAPNVVPDGYIRVIRDKKEYLELFSKSRGQRALGECSPTYLWDKDSPRLIDEQIPNARIIIMLRDPVSRAYSHYLHHVRIGWETRNFLQAVEDDYGHKSDKWRVPNLYVYQGLYCDQVERYLDTFGSERVKIIIFEEFANDTFNSLRSILEFLGIESEPPSNITDAYNPFVVPRDALSSRIFKNLNQYAYGSQLGYRLTHLLGPRITQKIAINLFFKKGNKPTIPENAKRFLEKIYFNDVLRLAHILAREELPWETFANPRENVEKANEKPM